MLSYTGQRNLFSNLINTSSSTVLAIGDTLMNERSRNVLSSRMWWFLEKAFTMLTDSTSQFVPLPGGLDRILNDPYVTVGSVRYVPREVPSRATWDELNLITYAADIPEWWYQYAGQLGLFPKPATSNNVITVNGRRLIKDLTKADYTTGTITTVATVTTVTTVTGSGTTWGSGMIGRYIRIDPTDAALGGDGIWYEIATVPSTTTLTLSRPYSGTAIAAGSATYTIGEMSLFPEAYQILPVYQAAEMYFTSIEADNGKAMLYKQLGGELYKALILDHSNRTGGHVLDRGITDTALVNPNLTVGF